MFVENDAYLLVPHKPCRGGMLNSWMRGAHNMPLLRSSEEMGLFFMACYKHATPPGFKITELIIETHKDFCPLRFMLLLPRSFFRFIGGQSLHKSIHILLKEA